MRGSHAHTHHHDHHHHGDDHDPHHHHHGHNSGHRDHLHSHPHGGAEQLRNADLKDLAASFVENFRQASDKTSFLRLSGIPFDIEGTDGTRMHLVDATIVSAWQIGTAAPGFASRELVYLPYPGSMVSARDTMSFTYVSLTERRDLKLTELLAERLDEAG